MKPLSSFKPQAVFSDIDGTLLTSEHVVSPLTSSAIHTLTDQGVLFTISSARSPSGIRPIIKKNDFHCCTIAFSGALILDEDQNILYEKGISISDASKIIDVIEKKCPHVTWNVFTSEDWIVKDRTDPHVIHEETVVETTSIEGSLQSLSDTLTPGSGSARPEGGVRAPGGVSQGPPGNQLLPLQRGSGPGTLRDQAPAGLRRGVRIRGHHPGGGYLPLPPVCGQ